MSFQVTTKQVQAHKIVSITRRVFIGDLQAHLDGSIKQLTAYAQANNVPIAGLPFSIYHGAVREDQDGAVEVCLPITGDVHPSGDMMVQELPAAQVAYATASLRQSIFPGILKAYTAIEEWIRANHHQIADSPREIWMYTMPSSNEVRESSSCMTEENCARSQGERISIARSPFSIRR